MRTPGVQLEKKGVHYMTPFEQVINQFKNKKVLVIGESMLDIYYRGTSNRICREAPVPIVDVDQTELFAGGGSNTAVNVSALGAETFFLSVTGADADGKCLKKILKQSGINTTYLLTDPTRQTMSKKRVIAHDQILVRYDQGSQDRLSQSLEKKLISNLAKLYPKMDAVIVSDYGYGIVGEKARTILKTLQAKTPKVLVVDSKYLDLYREVGITLAKPNFAEAAKLLGITKEEKHQKRVEQIKQYSKKLLDLTNSEIVAVTVDAGVID